MVPPKYVSVTVTVAVYWPFSGVTHCEGPADTDRMCAEASAGNTRTRREGSDHAAYRTFVDHLYSFLEVVDVAT